MNLVLRNFYHHYTTFGLPSVCHVRIIGDCANSPVVVCSELHNNPGPSVTNSAEALVASLSSKVLSAPLLPSGRNPLFIEHYRSQETEEGRGSDKDTFERISLNGMAVSWTRLEGIAELAKISGYPKEAFKIAPESLILPDQEFTKNFWAEPPGLTP